MRPVDRPRDRAQHATVDRLPKLPMVPRASRQTNVSARDRLAPAQKGQRKSCCGAAFWCGAAFGGWGVGPAGRVTVTAGTANNFYFLGMLLKIFLQNFSRDCQPARNTLLCGHVLLLPAIHA